ncbi:MAG: hypothetical protein LBD45_07185 [Bacteroidales bacterium]|jgi:antitoxin component HigA of HigAB toxin-antitoxin module|nr:hypothetical protein [Bacteroidales bacterium]
MKGIELLPFLTDEQKELLETSARNYKRFARVYFQILEFSSNTAVVKVWQLDNHTERYLTAKELIERTKEVFGSDVLPTEIKLHIRPIAFEKDALKAFTVETVEAKMLQFGLKTKDLVKLLDIDKSSLSQLLNKKREFSRSSKAMFYYFFKSLL